MCGKSFWKKIAPFAIALTLGIFVAGVVQKNGSLSEEGTVSCDAKRSGSRKGVGTAYGVGTGGGGYRDENETVSRAGTNALRLLSKPRARYTDEAREKQVTGVVRLKVTFLASGEIADITTLTALPYGLTEEAIQAAKQIRFQPATVNGVPQTVSKTVEYSFSIY